MLDFSDADEQREFANGPVPSGSIVVVQMEVLLPKPERQDPNNQYYSVAQSGLKQIYCQFAVIKGTYQGVNFRQNITLPQGVQNISLAQNQQTACNIGAATLKAICRAANRPTRVNNITDFTGMRFPVKVKINPKEKYGSDGRVFWNNEISLVITPDKDEYNTIRSLGEIINPDGAVTGDMNNIGKGNNGNNGSNNATSGHGGYDVTFSVPDNARSPIGVDGVPF